MTNWQSSNAITWFIKLYWALWNSVIALWDDQNVTWDAVGNSDWKTSNAPSWLQKAIHNWKTQNTSTWYTKN